MIKPLYINSLASFIGAERHLISNAVECGDYDDVDASQDDYISVSVEPYLASYEMAKIVVQEVFDQTDNAQNGLHSLFYASIHRHGQPRFWSPASWLQHSLNINGNIPCIAVQQGCNGLLQCLYLVANSQPKNSTANSILVGADRFQGSGFNRWKSDYGLLYGDAAAAISVSNNEGFAKILHIEIDGAPELEALHRDDKPRDEGSDSWIFEYDIRRTKKKFLQRHGREGFVDPLNLVLSRLQDGLLESPEWKGQVSWVFTPFVGSRIRQETYEAYFGFYGEYSGWEIGRELGHLGTTDGWVGLQYLRDNNKLSSGDHVLIVSAGVGFSCGLVLLEIL